MNLRAPGVDLPGLVSAIAGLRALWSESPANFEGRWYQLRDAYCEPRPNPAPPIMIGGDGEKYLLRAVAEHADWWNELTKSVPVLRHKLDVLRAHCDDVGRAYESIRKTYTFTVYLTKSKSDSLAWAGAAMDREFPPFAGTPAEPYPRAAAAAATRAAYISVEQYLWGLRRLLDGIATSGRLSDQRAAHDAQHDGQSSTSNTPATGPFH